MATRCLGALASPSGRSTARLVRATSSGLRSRRCGHQTLICWWCWRLRSTLRRSGPMLSTCLAMTVSPMLRPNATLGHLPVLLVRMNNDLVMGDDLKKTGAGNLFTVFGEPDIEIRVDGDQVVVEVLGVDVYDPTTGEVRSQDTDHIAVWMLDTEYNEESFFVRHCYFTGGNDPYARLKRALKADIDEEAWASLYSTVSRPFPRPTTGKIAIKVINDYGDEVMQVFEV